MGPDPLSVVAPARVKVLLLPIARITASNFQFFTGRLRQEDVVRLGDVSPDGRPHRTMFSPLAFPAGSVLYDISTSATLPSYSPLCPFELYREPLVILGVADGSGCGLGSKEGLTANGDSPDSVGHDAVCSCGHQSLLENLEGIRSAYPRALVHQILIFDHAKPNTAFPENLVAVPSVKSSKTTTIKTVMCDLTSQLLGEMTSYAKSIQALPSIESPKSTLSTVVYNASRPTSTVQGSRPDSPMKDESKAQHRMSMPVTLPSDPSLGKGNQIQNRARSPPSRVASPATTFDEIAGPRRLASPFHNISNDSRDQSKERLSMQGFGSGGVGEKERLKGKGRVGVVIGAMYLFAGRWPDAVKELTESASISKANSDYIWTAKALDYILVTLLLYAWAGMDFKVPQILYPGIDKSSSVTSKSSNNQPANSTQDLTAGTPTRLVSIQNLSTLIPGLVNNMLNLYVRAWTFTDDKIPILSFSESTIRCCKLLTIIHRSNGILNDQGLKSMVQNASAFERQVAGGKLSAFPSKAEIITILFRALPNSSAEEGLPVADRIVVLAGISSVLSDLGYHRKKALVLKELASTLLPALVQARKDGAAEMGVHPAASLIALGAAIGAPNTQHFDDRAEDSEYGLRDFLSLICKGYGIVLPAHLDSGGGSNHIRQSRHGTSSDQISAWQSYESDESIIIRAVGQASMSLCGSQQLKLDVLRACINVCEALPDLAGVLQFSADTLRTAGSGIAPGPESDNGSPALPLEDQVRLANNISRTLSASQKLGLGSLEAEYWDEFLVRGIELAEVSLSRLPTPHVKTELDTANASQAQAVKTPFIYNPFGHRTTSKALEPILIAGEDIMFRVTLQNLYDFELEIETVKLEAQGMLFETPAISTIIGPYRTQTVGLKGRSSSAGSLLVTGCVAKIKGCRERRFPLFAEPWFLKLDAKTRPQNMLSSNVMQEPTSSEPRENAPDHRQYGPRPSSLRLNVIDAQPNLVLKSVSLPQSAAMLLEGESRTFTIRLQNTSSSIPVDLILISFRDSTASQFQSALSNKALSLAELYELELSAARNPSFKWLRAASDVESNIAPGGTVTFTIEIFGRPGLSHGTIQVDFAHLGVPRSEVPPKFYTRQLLIPLAITVNASIDLFRNDLIPFSSDFAWQNQQRESQPPSTNSSTSSTPENHTMPSLPPRKPKDENRFCSLLSRLGLRSQTQEYVLLLLDLRNSWPNPLTTSIEVRQMNAHSHDQPMASDTWKRAYTVHETQQPGHTSRLVLIIPRLYVPHSNTPIPSLDQATKRQYVVNASGATSSEAELAARETFWYREELLKHIRATWREDSTGRSGSINLRSIHLSARMVSALRVEDLSIRFSVHPSISPCISAPSPAIERKSLNEFAVSTSTFVTLRTHIHNRSSQPVHPLIRLQPLLRRQPHHIALDLGKKFVWNGLLQKVLPIIEPGDAKEVDVEICILSEGEYEVCAVVEEVKIYAIEKDLNTNGESEVEDPVLKDWRNGNRERRLWYADEPCILIATESPELAE